MVFLVGLYCIWPKVSAFRIRVFCGCFCLVVAGLFVKWNYFAPPRIVVLDVGQGDAILVQHKASRVLIDAGPKNSLSDALLRNHVKSLDSVFVSHMHADHYQGLSGLPGYVKVDSVYVLIAILLIVLDLFLCFFFPSSFILFSCDSNLPPEIDRKSTRLNSSH